MLKQLTQIWILYWLQLQSILTWLFLACFIILIFYPRNIDSWGSRKLAPLLKAYDSSQSEVFDLRKTPLPPTNNPVPTIIGVKHTTRSLFINSYSLNELDAAQLKTLPNLQQLTLSTRDIPQNFLTTISSNLTELRIHSEVLLSHTTELSSLTKLKLLITDNQRLTPTLIQSIALIPNLQTLVITDKTSFERDTYFEEARIGFNNLTASELAPLLSRPITIYANWSPSNRLPQQFPTKVFPYFENNAPITMTSYFWLYLMIGWASITEHLSVLFRRPPRHLLPHFTRPHYVFAILYLVFLLVIPMSAAMTVQIDVLAAFTASLFPITIYSLWNLFPQSKYIHPYLLMFVPYFSPHLMTFDLLPHYWISLLHTMLTGHFIYFSVTTAILQLVIIATATHAFTSHLGSEPASHSLISSFFRSSYSNTLRHHHIKNFWRQTLLLRAGNNSHILTLFIGFSIIYLFFSLHDTDSRHFWESAMMTSTTLLIIMINLRGGIWAMEERNLSREFLAPRTRSRFTSQLFIATAIDHLWFLAPFTAITLFGFTQPIYREDAIQSLTALPSLLATICLILSMSLQQLAVPENRFQNTMLYIFSAILCLGLLSFTTDPTPEYFNTRLLISIIALIIIAPFSAFFITTAYYRTLNHEWGNPKT